MSQEPLKILLVEDDEDDAFFIQEVINDGVSFPISGIDHTPSFDEAISLLEQNSYDICLFDFRLGELDGIDLLKAVRSKHINIPIIFLTGQGDQEVAVEAMKAGATDYLTKDKLTAETLNHSFRFAIQLQDEAKRRLQAEIALKNSHEETLHAHRELQTSMKKLQTAQDQILRSEKLAGIGRLAAGVCHEILNPLNIISGHTQALLMEREDDNALAEDLNSVMEEIKRIEKIIGGLLKFSRKGEVELKKVNLNEEVNSVLQILEAEMGFSGISIVRDFDQTIPLTFIDSDRMRQVFMNILNNAKYAMKTGGVLTVTTQIRQKKSQSTNSESKQFLRIIFADTGTGISKEDMLKIFDPFFTTKPEDKGTGLGLSVCYSIVEKHGGNLEVESSLGKGATFTIDLPAIFVLEETKLFGEIT